MKYHNIFHVSLLEPAANDAYPGRNMEPPPPVEIDSEDQYFIEDILDSWIHRRILQYLTKWVGYDLPDWEPAELHSESEAIDTFHKKYPDKLGPLPNSTIYNIMTRIQWEITDHPGFEYCGLTTHHSSSRLGNSISPTLYSLVQPSVC
jgi:hypothetical protein